jgi:hypothetical protein
MRLGRVWVDQGWAETGARGVIGARRFDITIGDGGGLALRFRRGDSFFGLTALAARLGFARRHIGARHCWCGILRQSGGRAEAQQQASQQGAAAEH